MKLKKIILKKKIYKFYLLFICMIVTSAKAQDTLLCEYPFVKLAKNNISNSNQLDSLFAKLLRIENGSNEVVNIFHIGDSHIQADYITGELRRLFQCRFGNAGRGTMFPYKSAKTNGPQDYKNSFGGIWLANKAILPIKNNTNGLAAYSVSSTNVEDYILFEMKNCALPDSNATHKILVFHNKQNMGFQLKIQDWTNGIEYILNQTNHEKYSVVNFENPTCKWGIGNDSLLFAGGETILHGIVAYNNKPGVAVHNIGVNGIQAFHYLNNTQVFEDIYTLKPDLIIVSLGTNEGQDYKKTNDEFATQIDSFIRMVQTYTYNTPLVITTPLESFKWNRPNPHIGRVAQAWNQVASNKNIMLWDLYEIAGGKKSSYHWIRNGLFSKDKVHQSIKGYKLQGDLLYDALMSSYYLFKNNTR
jgi:lysophospholipase L1-like esterase